MSPRPDEEASVVSPAIFQHPLAYVLGLEGIALLRAFAGEYDREFTLARIQEIRTLLDAADELGDGVEETPMTMQEGYAQWAPWYDEPGNQLQFLSRQDGQVRRLCACGFHSDQGRGLQKGILCVHQALRADPDTAGVSARFALAGGYLAAGLP